jgi:hypothetical protein
MTRETDIPHGPLPLGYTLGGLLPQVGLHHRGGAFYQQSSYWHLCLAGIFLVPAIVFTFLPLDTYPKWVFVGFFLFTAACGAAPYFVRNGVGQTIIVDAERRTLRIRKSGNEKTIPWSDLVALQLCRQEKPSSAYQLNLVWKCADGTFARHCLAMHQVQRYVLGLARSYESLLSMRLSDETGSSQLGGAANRSQPVRPETNQSSAAAGSGR